MATHEAAFTSSPPLSLNPNHVQSTESTQNPTRRILRITSYAHRRGPLIPNPDLRFDIRSLPNPPKNVRDQHTGLSKALRDWFFADDNVKERFENVCSAIEKKLDRLDYGNGGEEQQGGEMVVNVGVCCVMGRHRSVAFVEELGRRRWSGWGVEINHRDVDKASASRKQHERQLCHEGD